MRPSVQRIQTEDGFGALNTNKFRRRSHYRGIADHLQTGPESCSKSKSQSELELARGDHVEDSGSTAPGFHIASMFSTMAMLLDIFPGAHG